MSKRKAKGPYPHGEKRGGKVICEYVYDDAQGRPYHKVERTEDKQFPQYWWVQGAPGENSHWQPGAPKGAKMPYMLPLLLEADTSQPIFICEGEKDAESVAALGFIATTNPGGAGKWSADLNEWFKDRQTIYVLEDNDAPGRKHARKVAAALADLVSDIRIVRFPDVPEGEDVTWWLEHGGGTKDRLIERAAATPVYQPRVRINIEPGEMDRAARELEVAMVAADVPILRRGTQLVEPLWETVRTKDGRNLVITTLRSPTPLTLAELVSKHVAEIYKRDGRHKGDEPKYVRIDPPEKMMKTILERGHYRFPAVAGIVNSPTMRSDGSLLVEPGYDEQTQLWHQPAETITLPNIPEQPSKADAETALKLLTNLLLECSFVGEVDRSVALAAMLTTVLRGAFTLAPMFLFHKPEPGTGASYLTNIIATLSTGQEAVPLATANDNPAEFYKELSAAASQARPILNLNNLTADLKSPLLAQMITEGAVDVRRFGKNDETMRCDCRGMTMLANGNNIRVVGELVRRALTCRLNAKMDRPETRHFKQNPIGMIKQNRGVYLAAIFTIVRAFTVANAPEPEGASMLAGFDEWARWVRWPLVWLGCADPVRSQEDARARDPELIERHERLGALAKYFGNRRAFTAADVYAMAAQSQPNARGVFVSSYPDLLEAFSRDGRLRSSKSIGKQLADDEDKQWGECRLEIVVENDKRSNAYRVVGKPPGGVDEGPGPSDVEPM